MQIWNGSGTYCGRCREDTILFTDRRRDGQTGRQTDGWTDNVKPEYPFSTSLNQGVGGIIIVSLADQFSSKTMYMCLYFNSCTQIVRVSLLKIHYWLTENKFENNLPLIAWQMCWGLVLYLCACTYTFYVLIFVKMCASLNGTGSLEWNFKCHQCLCNAPLVLTLGSL